MTARIKPCAVPAVIMSKKNQNEETTKTATNMKKVNQYISRLLLFLVAAGSPVMLFAGDDDDFSSTLVLLAQMPSYEEAADYLFHDLLWDRRDENVQAFMEILKAHMPA